MNFNAHDNSGTVLVAPRPVRLAAPTPYTHFANSILQRPQARHAVRLVSAPADALDRLKLTEDGADQDLKPESAPPSDRDSVSPRASPRASVRVFAFYPPPIVFWARSGLTSEALEEFLSILRPSTAFLFPPHSPVLRASNANASGAYLPYRRPASTRLSPSVSDHLLTDHADAVDKENDAVTYPLKLWGGDHLGSHTCITSH
ncbi:hypothetical protein EIP91_009850 [Steccherinum ochraceum]|uniref:Uncharacterized protein n=1 Tax=Steccherinum ochraceum TaxID=92696 RepID=A0A4R0RAH5_9APHY|nr:hypothetical protein EIP91_009850 [Steccherinum ochraceum]